MVIWERLGIIGILIPFGFGIVSQLLFGDTPIYAGIGYLLSSVPVWYFGTKWNSSKESNNRKHTLFWIHLEYWGLLAGLIGLMLIISETVFQIETDTYFILFGIGLILILFHQYSKSKSSIKDILYKLLPIRIIKSDDLPKKSDSGEKKLNVFSDSRRKVISKEKPNTENKISETRKAIEEFKNNKVKLRKFEPSDHSRFMPSNTELNDNLDMDDQVKE